MKLGELGRRREEECLKRQRSGAGDENSQYVLDALVSKNYKIALLADMHSKVNPRILPMHQSNNPDMICIVGDLCNTSLS